MGDPMDVAERTFVCTTCSASIQTWKEMGEACLNPAPGARGDRWTPRRSRKSEEGRGKKARLEYNEEQ